MVRLHYLATSIWRNRECCLRVALTVAWICVLACTLLHPAQVSAVQKRQTTEANQLELDAEALEEFKEEIDEYLEKRRKLEKKLPPLSKEASAASLHEHGLALEKLIVAARVRAQEGDLFVSEIQPLLRRLIREVLSGPDGPALRTEIREELAAQTLRLRINTRYPDGVPLATIPYPLLKVLPPLPEQLEYRFLGNNLLLLDSNARIILDILRNAIPI